VVLTLDILIVKGAAVTEHTAALVWAIFVAGSPNLVN